MEPHARRGALLEVLELEGRLGNKFWVDDGLVVFGPEAGVVAPVAGMDELLLEYDEYAVVHADLVGGERETSHSTRPCT